jgi:alkanesulfonate monooxygenase SsuD/methylene tetrahydromethanopterin reductase-like flavin-dependent oxidoreductase (luciferase family)
VLLAKQVASLDVLSGGRFDLGLMAGYLRPNLAAFGADEEDPHPRAEEYIRAMIELWTAEKPTFEGRWVSFSNVDAYPRPVQKPYPPIWFGGYYSGRAAQIAATYATGWFCYNLDADAALDEIERVRQHVPNGFRFTVAPRGGAPTPREMERYAEAGVERVVLAVPYQAGVAGAIEFIKRADIDSYRVFASQA